LFRCSFWCNQVHGNVNAADHQDTIFLLHLSGYICRKLPVARVNLARFQRASEGTHHSTSRRRDHVVDSGSMRLLQFSGIHFIVLRDRSMNTVNNRLRFTRQMCDPEGTTFALNPRFRNINNLGHDMLQILVDDSPGILAVRAPEDEPESPSQWNECSARGETAR